MLTVGTHNLHDETGHPTPFADVILFTEAIHSEVRDELATTHDVYVCWQQRDLIIAISKRLKQERVNRHYRLVHPGVAKVTPHRGEFWLTLRLEGVETAVQVGHWINAAHPPYRRGEAGFRRAMWRRHQRIALRIIRRHKRKGRVVLAGGDLNTPHGVKGYAGVLHEVGDHFDRLGSTVRLRDLVVMSRMGSDHPRLRARVA
jgi:hypothetical protein